MQSYKDETIEIDGINILGTHFLNTDKQLAILNTQTAGAYLIPVKFDNEDKALEYYKNHLVEK